MTTPPTSDVRGSSLEIFTGNGIQPSTSQGSNDTRDQNIRSRDLDREVLERPQLKPQWWIDICRPKCGICSSSTRVYGYYGIVICAACRSCIGYFAKNKVLCLCRLGNYNCDITWKPKADRQSSWQRPPCRACRLERAFELGLKHPLLLTTYPSVAARSDP